MRNVLVVATALAFALPLQAAPLTPAGRTERCEWIRDVSADNGISRGFLLAGIAEAETNLSHCWTELDWACQGPASPDCDGGPVVAGAGDGPCSAMEGGLGMFQFDGGNFDETIARDGDGVLLISGNTTRAVDFVVNMVMNSQYIDASTPEEAKAWMNQVTVDGPLWDAWITTVTHYYNGCNPDSCGVFNQRYQHYSDSAANVYFEQGEAFWDVAVSPCASIPGEGRVLEETDTCFTKGGPLPYWRVGMGGESNLHIWTGTTMLDDAVNFAEWNLTFDEAGLYELQMAASGGDAQLATYLVTHGGMVTPVTIDQSTADGYVSLGQFEFAAGGAQSIFVGDNTQDPEERRLVVDALRILRVDIGAGGAGSGAGGSGPGGQSGVGGESGSGGETAAGGFGSTGGGDAGGGGGGADGSEEDGGCDCRAARPSSSETAGLSVVALFGLVFARRRTSTRQSS